MLAVISKGKEDTDIRRGEMLSFSEGCGIYTTLRKLALERRIDNLTSETVGGQLMSAHASKTDAIYAEPCS